MKPLLTESEVLSGVARLAAEITSSYRGRPLTMIGVMTGSVAFLADLMRRVDLPLRVGVIQARSYRGGDTRPGELAIHSELVPEVQDRDVLLVDDIFDTGRTLTALVQRISELGARSVRSCVLLSKPARVEVTYRPEFVGFEIPDRFVVGYGMDYLDAYRNLPHVAELEDADLHRDQRP
ncbi:MAG: hypoxanthine phosphoribosyltransferase [Planctomycetia bacterium]|nr:hypoxanthine phosphoribosyltransferase [Planctomycetia bacterium]